VAERECREPFASTKEERIGADQERTRPQLDQSSEDRSQVAFSARLQHMELRARARPLPAGLSLRYWDWSG
jgi:hypothetical protein